MGLAFQHPGLPSLFLQNRAVLQEVFAKYFNNENFKNTQLFCKALVTKTSLRSAPHSLCGGCATISTLNRDIMESDIPFMPLSPPRSLVWTLFLSDTAACSKPCFQPLYLGASNCFQRLGTFAPWGDLLRGLLVLPRCCCGSNRTCWGIIWG